jgi:hypothetical protein
MNPVFLTYLINEINSKKNILFHWNTLYFLTLIDQIEYRMFKLYSFNFILNTSRV